MSLNGLVPLEISDFGGLYTSISTLLDAPVSSRRVRGRGRGLFVAPTALDAKNLRYLRGGFVTRPGLESVFTGTAATGAKATHIGQLITQENLRQVLVVTSDGQLWREPDAGVALTNLKDDWAKGATIGAATIGHSATLFDREHIAISDSSRVGVGSPIIWDRTNLDRLSPAGPGRSHTLALGGAGSNTNGVHKVVVIFVSRTGYLTTASTSVEINVTTTLQIDVSNIPTGPDWVEERIIAMTEADGASYFYDPDTMVIGDNTSTTLTIDIADASLVALVNVDRNFRLESLSEVAGFVAYRDRMVSWGGRSRIQIPNLDFDGGFDPANAGLPAGWEIPSAPNFGGASQETSDVYFGHAFKVTGDGVNATRGRMKFDLSQISSTFARDNFPAGKTYRVRLRLKRSASATEGTFRVIFTPTGGNFDVPAASMSTSWQVFEGTLTLGAGIPTHVDILVVGSSGTMNPLESGEFFIADDVQIYRDDLQFESSTLRVSDPSDPQAYDGVKGLIQASPDDGERLVNAFVFRGLLFIVKERSLYVTRDDGVNPPALWTVDFVDKVGCDGVHAVAVAGQSFALLLYRDGIYVIRGLLPQDISDELQDSPVGLPSMDDRNEAEAYKNHIAIEDEKTEAHFAIVRSGDTWPERVFKLNYRHGWGMEQRRWSYDEFKIGASDLTIGASALIQEATKQRIFFGAETGDIERHEGNDDLGNDIETNWRSAYLSFLGLAGARGKSIFNAVVMHGETLGTSPELDINGYKMDNTQVTLINNATLSLATLFERRINQIVEKMSFEINVAGTGDPRVSIDSLVLYGRPFHLSGAM